LAGGLGATFSTVTAGWIADHFGSAVMFVVLAAVGASAIALIWIAMPETHPASKGPTKGSRRRHAKNATLPA
jgi:predicted MFS family arabinose efflux permease